MEIAFIGGGSMGEAILSAVISRGLAGGGDITVSDVSSERLGYLNQKYGVNVTPDNASAVTGCDIVLLAVKPQNVGEILPQLKNRLKKGQLVISIIAGTRISTLRDGLKHDQIIRTMPNTPAQIGEGMTVWVPTPEVTPGQKEAAKAVLSVMGKEIAVSDESLLDGVTAVSGSGPAYVFLFIESLIAAAERIGLPPDMARVLVFQTVLGSARFAEKSDRTLLELKKMVTSPGGTTAEALARFEGGKFTELVYEAVLAAYDKSRMLGG